MSPVAVVYRELPAHWDWIELSERRRTIEERCTKNDGGCWLYPNPGRQNGYAQITFRADGIRQQWVAHRLMWVLEKGPIPEGLFVCHTCDVRNCVNPQHLWLGTCEQNQQDRVKKGRHAGNRKIT